MRPKHWWSALGALVSIRLAIPLVALSASGSDLPGLPAYTYVPLNGDAFGYYAAARETIAAAGRVSVPVALVLGAVLAAAVLTLRRTWRGPKRWLGILVGGGAVALAALAVVDELAPPGAPVIGWPLLWAVPLAPYRLLAEPGPDVAFGFGFALSLAAIATTVIATAHIGLYATGRRWIGLLAAALYTVWPFLARLAAGEQAWENGQWHVDVGLHLYTEPLSTALVAVALAIVLRPRSDLAALVLTGHLLGLATAVKLSNAVIAVVLIVVVGARSGLRSALAFAAAGATWIPVVVSYWPKGYVELYGGSTGPGEKTWSLDNAADAWTESLVFTPAFTLTLVALAALGAAAIRRPFAAFPLAASVLVTAALYSVYSFTPDHPRFFYVVLPPLLVLVAASPTLFATNNSPWRSRPDPSPANDRGGGSRS